MNDMNDMNTVINGIKELIPEAELMRAFCLDGNFSKLLKMNLIN